MVNLNKKKNCIIVGGSGFIGQNLIRAIDKKKYNITLLGRETTDFSFIDNYYYEQNINTIKGDFSNQKTFINSFKGQDCILNLLGASLPGTSMINPKHDIDFNIIPSLYILQAATLNGVKKIIFSSSGGAVYGDSRSKPTSEEHTTNPLNMYGISKLTIEKMLLAWNKIYGMENIILRIGNAYGVGQKNDKNFGAVAVFVDKIINKKKIEVWGSGNVVRDYVYIDDVVNAFNLALNINLEQSQPKVYNIGSGVGTSVNALIEIIEKLSKIKSIIEYQSERALDVKENILNIDAARKYLLYDPKYSIEDGIKKMLQIKK